MLPIEEAPAFGAGTKAYYDAHVAILPCVVLEVLEPGDGVRVSPGRLRIRVTENSGPYRKGEELTVPAHHAYPRTHQILKSSGHYRINPYYRWVTTGEGQSDEELP